MSLNSAAEEYSPITFGIREINHVALETIPDSVYEIGVDSGIRVEHLPVNR